MTTATDNIENAKRILGSASESEKTVAKTTFDDEAIEAGGGAWRKPWVNPGDALEAVFVGYDLEADKFNPGKQRTVATWKEIENDTEFRTGCSSDLANLVAKLANGRPYRVVYVGTVKTGKGYAVKKFKAYPAKSDVPF
jgi:hypothetical protein